MKINTVLTFLTAVVLAACAADSTPDAESTESAIQSAPRSASICGGVAGLSCPTGLVCVDNPGDTCDPARGGADCAGTCQVASVPTTPRACGGLADLSCPQGFECVDNPGDTCDPARGGADCAGLCQAR
jgi:hypothetical protein